MNILVCPDKFKDSLSASEAVAAIREGILRVLPDAIVTGQPLADGGEGSLQILQQLLPLKEHRLEVTGPLRRPVSARYLMGAGKAYIESAEACGLQHVPRHRRDPGFTTTIGVGQLIEDALARGATEINLFLGGSATNDGGAGMAAALGYTFRSDRGNDFVPSGNSLRYVTRIGREAGSTDLRSVTFRAVCDVNNPLLGPAGATYTYATQKGAQPEDLPTLEAHQKAWAAVVSDACGMDHSSTPGAGAAGGLGYGALSFLNAEIVSGTDWLIEAVGLRQLAATADLIITGEGQIDEQTLSGKVVAGVGRLAYDSKTKAWAICSSSRLPNGVNPVGIERVISLVEANTISPEESINNGKYWLTKTIADQLRQFA
ncbi:glycerate kinase [Lewinella sp. 4G2]|uniref:glycerate kinase n=1 Tax=Lewinella sp. 4G2 TaxID=1803372 RepID=UPI0007B46478|nr:glycerate kinase [Lewinella sp. 4G2]OAV44588.1 hypothetical protein A3850_008825 [Lewinella sp. 4G2]